MFFRASTYVPPLLRKKERRGRRNNPVEEKRVLTQAAVRLAALIALILFIEFGIVTNKFIWYTALFLVPIKVYLFLTSIDVLASLKTALQNWFVVPLIRWIGRGA